MDLAYTQRNPTKHFTGLGLAVAFHVFLGYALVSGLAHKVVEVIKQPLDVKLIQEIKPPPPPEAKAPPPPQRTAAPPPPAYVPPPEVAVAPAPQAPTLAAVTTTPQPPAPPPVVQAAPAPHVPVRVAPVIDAARNCPKPEYPAAARRNEEEGTVVLRFLISPDGNVKDSAIASSSGSKRLDEAARDTLSRCRFKAGSVDGAPEASWATLKYTWRLDE